MIDAETRAYIDNEIARVRDDIIRRKYTLLHAQSHRAGGGDPIPLASGPPSGPAGGDLSGTYPNPSVKPAHAGSSHQLVETLLYTVGDGTNVIPAGIYGDWSIQFPATILEWDVLATLPIGGGGNIQLDLWKTTYALFNSGTNHPVVGDTITGTDKPRIITAQKGQSTALTGWTTALATGDIVRVNVDSATNLKLVLLVLKVQRT